MAADSPWIAALAAVFLWWFSTGAILWRVRAADNRGAGAHRASVVWGLPVLALGLLGARLSFDLGSAAGVYLGFVSALVVWGWIELAFLSGLLTGPNARPCPPGVQGWPRFARAVGTIAWHELALAMTTLALIHAAWGAANPFAAWTFAMLFLARVSAKLNLFFGVPRINTEFLPRTLSHLPSHFRLAPMNGFFPLSVTILSFAAACWLERTVAAGAGWEVAGFSLLLTITLLALLEHWFMVLPVPDQKLWRWMMPAPRPALMRHDRLQEDPNGS